jgi:hypothetical protein
VEENEVRKYLRKIRNEKTLNIYLLSNIVRVINQEG